MTFFGTSKPRISFRTTRIREASIATPNDVNDSGTEAIVAKALSKKPAASIASVYLHAAAVNQYGKVQALPPTKQNWPEYERLRLLAWRLRKNIGLSPWPPLAFALCVLIAFGLWAHRQSAKDFTYAAPEHKFQILRRYDAHHFQFRWIRPGTEPLELGVVFCPNYEPQLSAGETLTWLHYQDMGRCWDILPEGYGYKFERDAQGTPTLSPNCVFNDRDLTDCKPNQMEARF